VTLATGAFLHALKVLAIALIVAGVVLMTGRKA
jgi:hypothetical protein